MELDYLNLLFETHHETTLKHRYITNTDIKPLLNALQTHAVVETVGKSVLNDDIHTITIGNGKKRILMWSQMHGNESTTTKALFDFLNLCISNNALTNGILNKCTLCIIPILNPDGAKAYTRINANKVDLNRDAQDLSQPESKVLRAVFESFKPDFCYNLHGQRTIFSVDQTNKSAIVSFLSPAQDKACTVTPTRKKAMEVIAEMNRYLQKIIPESVGVYDDAFNINCVGDTFQTENVPTILFEAGHYPEDYAREKTRELIFISYLTSLNYLSRVEVTGENSKGYFEIPENGKLFFDIIIRNARVTKTSTALSDVAIQYLERLEAGAVHFVPIVKKIERLPLNHGHKEYDAKGALVTGEDGNALILESENVFVNVGNKKLMLFLK